MLKKIGFLILLFTITGSNLLFSYDGTVHSKINENAINPVNSKIDDFLKNQLGVPKGIENKLSKGSVSKTIKEWIKFAGKAEDFGKGNGDNSLYDLVSTRAYNHFHNPLKDWSNAGLDSSALVFFNNRFYSRDPVSTVLWSLNPGAQDFSQNTTGDWSWGKAKESYYTYLTGKNFNNDVIADTESERNSNFTDCFRALGQTMHLLEDMSVPLHTRNDVHIFPLGKMAGYKISMTMLLKRLT
jgi:hypothetical protein